MNFRKIILGAFLFITPFALMSCLSNVENEQPSQIQIGLELDGIDNTLTLNEDALNIQNVQFIHGLSFFIRGEDSLLIQARPREILIDNNIQNTPAILPLTFFPDGNYQEFNFLISRAEDNDPLVDPAFTNGGRFSMIVNGTYNGSSFSYRSERVFNNSFSLEPNVQVPEFNQSFIFIVSADVRSWFLQEGSQGFIDPRDDANATAINDNIGESFIFELSETLTL